MAEGPGTPRGKGASGGNPKTSRGGKPAGAKSGYGRGQPGRSPAARTGDGTRRAPRPAAGDGPREGAGRPRAAASAPPAGPRRRADPAGPPGRTGAASSAARPGLRQAAIPVTRTGPPRPTDPVEARGRPGVTTSVAAPGPRPGVTSAGSRPTAARAGPLRVTAYGSEERPTGGKGRHPATGLRATGRAGQAQAGRGQPRAAAGALGSGIHTVRARARLTAGARPGVVVPGRVPVRHRIGRPVVRAARPGGHRITGPGQAQPRARAAVTAPRDRPEPGTKTGATGASHVRVADAPGLGGTRRRLAVPGRRTSPGRRSPTRSAPSSSIRRRELS